MGNTSFGRASFVESLLVVGWLALFVSMVSEAGELGGDDFIILARGVSVALSYTFGCASYVIFRSENGFESSSGVLPIEI